MKTVILTKGLPGSGKSTWAKAQQAEKPNQYVLVSKDDLRATLHQGVHSKANERMVIQLRDVIIVQALDAGKNVIVHDTNLNPVHEKQIRELVFGKARVVIQDFTHVPLETCIANDLKRLHSVGEQVIRRMHRQYLNAVGRARVPELRPHNPALQHCIIVDVDGTLAHMNGRSPYEWLRVGEDTVNETVAQLVRNHRIAHPEDAIFIMSGRDAVCRPQTTEWLNRHNISFDDLFMRPEGDNRKDNIVKRELFEQNVAGRANVRYVLDDRVQVVREWRSLGLVCLQVAEGDF